MTTEYRIRSTDGGGYHGGKRDRFTLYTDAETALTEYRRRVEADTFLPMAYRQAHLRSLVIEARETSDWNPIPTPGQGPPPHPSS